MKVLLRAVTEPSRRSSLFRARESAPTWGFPTLEVPHWGPYSKGILLLGGPFLGVLIIRESAESYNLGGFHDRGPLFSSTPSLRQPPRATAEEQLGLKTAESMVRVPVLPGKFDGVL